MFEIILRIEKRTIKARIGNTELPNPHDNILCILKDIAFFNSNAIQVSQTNQKIHINVNMPLRIIANQEVNVPIVFGILGGMLKTTFKQKVVLQCRDFMQDVSFQECVFENNLSMIGCNFHKNALFDNAKINGFFVGSKSVFHKQASFWNVDFKEIPNFSGVGFTESNLVNFVNAKVDNSFEKLSQLAKNETRDKDNDTSNQIRNDIRDSYRTIKNTLIQQNNLLDASQWHKLELYAKEIELDSKEYKEIKNNNEDFRDCVDKWILKFYRHTSDHHTDLVRIIHWVIILIGYFSLALFLGKYNYHLEIFFNNHSNNMPINLTNDFINTMVESKLIYLISFIAYIGICLKPIRLLIGYIGTFLIITINPKYIFGIASIFSNKYHFTYTENIIITIYSILMFLLLFSLQKTARKNSIIPH